MIKVTVIVDDLGPLGEYDLLAVPRKGDEIYVDCNSGSYCVSVDYVRHYAPDYNSPGSPAKIEVGGKDC